MTMELDAGDKDLLQRALAEQMAVNKILRFLSDYFRDKYGLSAQHSIQPDGTIRDTLSGNLIVPSQENGRVSENDDMRVLQNEMAMRGET
jgi:hypothetical protein